MDGEMEEEGRKEGGVRKGGKAESHRHEGALELGGEEVFDYSPPSVGHRTCVILSEKAEPWWEESAWAFGCKVVDHIVVGDGEAVSWLGKRKHRMTVVKGWEAGWNRARELKASVILVEGKLTKGGLRLVSQKPNWLELVVASSCGKSEKSNLHDSVVSVNHSDIGGVTDRVDRLLCFMPGGELPIVGASHAPQDLRSVLKAGISGRKAPCLEGVGSVIGQSVKELRPGLISCRGLLPTMRMSKQRSATLKVRTIFGAGLWTDRRFSDAEILMSHDVSEDLFKRCDDQVIQGLRRVLSVPIRTRVELGRACREIWERGVPTKRSAVTESEPERSAKRANTAAVSTFLPTMDWSPYTEDPLGGGQSNDTSKATKADDAPIPTFYWNKFLLAPFTDFIHDREWGSAAITLRRFFFRHMRRNRVRSYRSWRLGVEARGMTVSEKSRDAARDAIGRYANSDFWNWSKGSRPFFWEWPEEFQERMRDGIKLWFREHLEPYTRAQKAPLTRDEWEKVRVKLNSIRDRGYVESGVVESLTNFFNVPKGEDDIRMVYDGTASGLNASLWAPWFPLPTVESLLRAVEPGTFMCDADVGEMFLNFMLHEEVKKMCGVDFTLYFPNEVEAGVGHLWERWGRCAMGLTTSPYQAIQGMMWARELILGDRLDETNVFRWERLEMNLPGMPDYDPSKMWACKVRKDGQVACDLFVYCDDCRYTGPTETECWKAAQRGASILGRLGLQNAARKTRPPKQADGAWAGSVVHADQGEVAKLVTQARWDKTRGCIREIVEELEAAGDSQLLHRASLGSKRGFLVYVGRTYDWMVPYLKGIHATMESWRPDRDPDGWKIQNFEWEFEEEDLGKRRHEPGYRPVYKDGPEFVKAVPRLLSDLRALLYLTESLTPPRVVVRSKEAVQVRYGFGDASGLGYGSAVTQEGGKTLRVRVGTWKWTISQEKSSNWRELRNLVKLVKDLADAGKLRNCELFLFTDNSVAERAFFRGTSSSRSLFELVLELRKLTISGHFKLHVIHVAGTRMIECGVDGVSRSDLSTGVMRGTPMLQYVPLHLNAIERCSSVTDWVKSWLPTEGSGPVFLKPEEWFEPFVKGRVHVWTPPPAAADYAVELMAEGLHKRPDAFHVFIVPRLLTARWRKVLGRATDVLFHVPPKLNNVWEACQHEPLTIALVFPLSSQRPWRMGNFEKVKNWETELRGVCKSDPAMSGSCLRKLWISTCKLGSV